MKMTRRFEIKQAPIGEDLPEGFGEIVHVLNVRPEANTMRVVVEVTRWFEEEEE